MAESGLYGWTAGWSSQTTRHLAPIGSRQANVEAGVRERGGPSGQAAWRRRLVGFGAGIVAEVRAVRELTGYVMLTWIGEERLPGTSLPTLIKSWVVGM